MTGDRGGQEGGRKEWGGARECECSSVDHGPGGRVAIYSRGVKKFGVGAHWRRILWRGQTTRSIKSPAQALDVPGTESYHAPRDKPLLHIQILTLYLYNSGGQCLVVSLPPGRKLRPRTAKALPLPQTRDSASSSALAFFRDSVTVQGSSLPACLSACKDTANTAMQTRPSVRISYRSVSCDGLAQTS